jgi:DNA-binding IclR family transcriptional regulator
LTGECRRWRRLGYAWRRQPVKDGANSRVAVPVFDPHAPSERLAGSLGIVCDAGEVNAMRAAEWAVLLRAGARRLEKEL